LLNYSIAFPFYNTLDRRETTSTSTSHLHHKTNSDKMDHSDEPKYTCKCGQVFGLYEPLANDKLTKATSATGGVHKQSRKAYPAHVNYYLENALLVGFGMAAFCWTYMIYDYVRSFYI
jgi:hypothetical protein